jgi:hypothetical protein
MLLFLFSTLSTTTDPAKRIEKGERVSYAFFFRWKSCDACVPTIMKTEVRGKVHMPFSVWCAF